MFTDPEEVASSLAQAPSVFLSASQRATVELLGNGSLAPLAGFMLRAEAETVRETGRLPGAGGPFPCPVTLVVPLVSASALRIGSWLALKDVDGTLIGGVRVEELSNAGDDVQVGGRVVCLPTPAHADFAELRQASDEVRRAATAQGWNQVLAYQPRQFLHRGLEEGLRMARERLRASVLLQILVHHREDLPLEHFTRVMAVCASATALGNDACQVVLTDVPGDLGTDDARRLRTWLAWRAGATHLAVAPDDGNDGCEAPKTWDRSFARELGLELIDLPPFAADPATGSLVEVSPALPPTAQRLHLEALEAALARDGSLPDWAIGPDVQRALAFAAVPRTARGFTVFLTGLSGAGKTTIARDLRVRLMERTQRAVSLLDGDLVRRHLSSELGFSREHRDLNIRRIGFVAAEITRHRGIAICAPIAPYDAIRREVRRLVEPLGGFILVHVATPLDVCEARDTKGLYARARSGELPNFTGVTDPYEPPADAEVVIDGERLTPQEASAAILRYLEQEGYVPERALGAGAPPGLLGTPTL